MTLIAAIKDARGNIYMLGDSAAIPTTEDDIIRGVRKDPKVFIRGQYGIGFAGSFRTGEILQHIWEPPVYTGRIAIERFMRTTFIESIKTALRKSDGELYPILVGLDGHIFNVQPDYHIGESLDPYEAIGSGETLALGGLHTLQGTTFSARTKLIKVAEAAEHHSNQVMAPFNIIKVERITK